MPVPIIVRDECHALAGFVAHMGKLLLVYDEANRPMLSGSSLKMLRYLMQEHNLNQSYFPEVDTQSVFSEILGGKCQLNVRQIRVLAERFAVSADVLF